MVHLFGLIGWPLGHSFSKKYFSEKFEREHIPNVRYELFPLENIRALPALLQENPALRGLNVTIPYKTSVIPYLDALDQTAQGVGAVNCIKILDQQKLVGYNTDVIGFENSLKGIEDGRFAKPGAIAFILGTGGAAKAVAYVLQKLHISCQFVSRNPSGKSQISYASLAHINLPSTNPCLLINCSPLGTYPQVDEMPPVSLDFFKPGMLVYDLIYNPAETLLLREAKTRGCTVKNGLQMLEMQAEAAWKIWETKALLYTG